MLSKRKAMFRQKIGYVIIRNYYMIARNRTPFSTFQMKILTWKTKIHRKRHLGQPITTNIKTQFEESFRYGLYP